CSNASPKPAVRWAARRRGRPSQSPLPRSPTTSRNSSPPASSRCAAKENSTSSPSVPACSKASPTSSSRSKPTLASAAETLPQKNFHNRFESNSVASNQFDSCRNVETMTSRAWSSTMSNLQGKVALVTGASKGIGAAIARELAARGAAVAVNYSDSKAAAEKLVAEINTAGGKAIAVQANLSDPDSIGPLVKKTARELGPITTLINNAGIYDFGPIEAVTPEHFHKQ